MLSKNWYIGLSLGAILVTIILMRKPIVRVMSNMTRSQFIDTFAPTVKTVSKNTGLFPSLFLAQAILESNTGKSSLASLHNNFFGIKADSSWKGNSVTLSTKEVINGVEKTVNAKFRVYPNPEASFADRVKFLQSFKRYKDAGVFTAVSPYSQAVALQKAGYATDPDYANKLKSIMETNNLYRFDL